MTNLSPDDGVFDRNDFFVSRAVGEILAVVCFMGGKFRVIYHAPVSPGCSQSTETRPLTFQGPNNAEDNRIGDDMLDDGIVVQENEGLHNVAQPVKIGKTLEIFGRFHQREQLGDVVILDNKLGEGIPTLLGDARPSDHLFQFDEDSELWWGEHDRIGEALQRIV